MPDLNFEIANALYIHIPFCSSKCPYCDFYSTEYTKKRVDQYWAALFMEIEELSHKTKNNFIQTIYFGGGTPSLLSAELIKVLIEKINSKFKVSPTAEITMEVNPASINEKKLIALKRAGINRLSIGIQSFNNYYLKILGRKSSKKQNIKVLNLVNKYFNNYSLDIIFALPGQKLEEFKADLDQLLKFNVPHISLYNLELHESTPFYQKYISGDLKLPTEEVDAQMYELAVEKLEKNNYLHYEISNFAQKGYRARHNYIYWLYQPYLALGPGASGFDGKTRYLNKRSLKDYIANYNPKKINFKEMENKLNKAKINKVQFENNLNKLGQYRDLNTLSLNEKMAEFSFLALRTEKGLFFYKFYQKFKVEFEILYQKEIESLKEDGLIKVGNQRIYLTERGKELANEVFLKFLLE